MKKIYVLFVIGLMCTSSVTSQELKQACVPGELQCQITILMQCNETGTGWEIIDENTAKCCTPGKRECQVDDLMECNETGDGWTLVKDKALRCKLLN